MNNQVILNTQGTVVNKLGDYLRTVRKDRGLTLKDVDEAIGVSASYVNRIENGSRTNPSIATLDKLSKFYNITTSEVMQLAGFTTDEELSGCSQELTFFIEKSENIIINGKSVNSLLFKSILDKMITLDINQFSEVMNFCGKVVEFQKELNQKDA